MTVSDTGRFNPLLHKQGPTSIEIRDSGRNTGSFSLFLFFTPVKGNYGRQSRKLHIDDLTDIICSEVVLNVITKDATISEK